jgi:hypothetical protein
MYLPRAFAESDLAHLDALVAADPFVTLVTTDGDGAPFASHLPVLYRRNGDEVLLEGHWAKPNPQACHGDRALAIVHGPHHYVEEAVQQRDHLVGTELLGQGGRSDDVDEEAGDQAALAPGVHDAGIVTRAPPLSKSRSASVGGIMPLGVEQVTSDHLVDAVQPVHPEVEQGDVRPDRLDDLHRLETVRRLAGVSDLSTGTISNLLTGVRELVPCTAAHAIADAIVVTDVVDEHEVERSMLSLSGYWRAGLVEDDFQAWKKAERARGSDTVL